MINLVDMYNNPFFDTKNTIKGVLPLVKREVTYCLPVYYPPPPHPII